MLLGGADIEELYDKFKTITNEATEETVGQLRNKHTEGLGKDVELLCHKRRQARIDFINNPRDIEEQYRTLNKSVKKEIQKFKSQKLESKITQMENDFQNNNSNNLFKTVKELEGKPKKPIITINDKQGNKQTKQTINKVLKCWEKHFKEHLNKKFPFDDDALNELHPNNENENNPEPISQEEIKKSITSMKNRKAPGVDSITAEVLKAGGDEMVQFLHMLFNKVWNEEKPPLDWSKMIVTPIHKKGSKLDPSNYRAISLISIPGKVFTHVLLQRVKDQSEGFIKDNQFGFRPNRGTIDAIFITRQIIEKAKEHNVHVHFNFVDFKSAFDTIWREALWKMLSTIGITKKIINIIKKIYENTECAITVDGKLTNWFSVLIGLRQGCLLSPTLFNIFLEFVLNEIRCLPQRFAMNDNELALTIKYADDTTLLALGFQKLQELTSQLQDACTKWGMEINNGKCKVLTPLQQHITIEGNDIENLNGFVFLGSSVPDVKVDIDRRIALASTAFGRLRKSIWSKRNINMELKMRLFSALIVPIAIYGAETWVLTTKEENKLNVFEMRCLRSILGISRRDRIRNVNIRRRTQSEKTIVEVIKTKRLKWFGHVCRKQTTSLVYQSYKQDFPQKRSKGRPPKRWSDQIRNDTRLPLLTAERNTKDRTKWVEFVRRVAKGH